MQNTQNIQETAGAVYTQDEETSLRQAIEAYFGPISQVLREIVTPDMQEIPGNTASISGDASSISVDLYVISPAPERPYYTIVTCGMGARDMLTPRDMQEFARAELLFLLPESWDINHRDESCYWPLRWLKVLARLPWEEESWLGWGHTVPNGEPFAENTDFSSILLLEPYQAPEACAVLQNGVTVHFYQCFALYEEELAYQLEHGMQALLEQFAARGGLPPVLDLGRANLFPSPHKPTKKQLKLQKHQLRPLLRDWQGPAGCLATDRILVDGAAVGYCYREAPAGSWDSGWRFTAGDESDDYMDDPRRSDVYTLNCVANYDADILGILATPAPCAFARGEAGLTQLKRIR